MPRMEIRQNLQLSQKQKLVLTQRIQQSLEMLQLPSLELERLIRQELEENPLLETEEPGERTEEGPETAEETKEETEREDQDEEDPLDILKQIEENEGYSPSRSGYGRAEEEWTPEPVREPTLADHLMAQIYNRMPPPELERAAVYVVYSLDRHGLLSLGEEELLTGWDGSPEVLRQAVDLVRELDPPGVGRTDAREALLVQLRQQGYAEDSLEYALVDRHFRDLIEKKIPSIARAEGASPHRVQEAVENVSHLNPWPGSDFAGSSNSVVIPDLTIRKIDGKLRVFLNDSRFPSLRISSRNRRILESPSAPDKEKEYVKKKFKRASWFIKAIAQRQETMLKIGGFLADYQEPFFEHGIEALKPLTLQQVADALDYNQSTISRAINGKYLQSPRGIHELRFFFSRGLSGGSGQMSTRTVKDELRKLIDSEDKSSPYSDSQLAEILQSRGIDVKRRTIANYRNDLGIESARKRKRY